MKKWHYPFLAFLIIGTILILTHSRSEAKPEYRTAQGLVFGTSYHITYLYNADLQEDIEQTLALVDNALSMFNPNSTISAVNRSESVFVDDTLFLKVFRRAMEISDLTGGAFDITVAPAVNAWGFGFKHAENIRQATIDSLLEITGYNKIHETDGMITKNDPCIMLDCSAIAKGFGSDMVANMLRSKGISDFMVEIGGEIVLSGQNPKGKLWIIGISKPVDDSLSVSSELQTVIPITDIAMATSMMVMGLDSAQALLSRHPEFQAYLIYQTPDGTITDAKGR